MIYYIFLIYYKLKYSRMDEDAIMDASKNGDFKFLEWFKNSGYKFKYDKLAIIDASRNGHIQVLEWFKNYCNIKKIIKILGSYHNKTIKFKTKNNYIKGYNKN